MADSLPQAAELLQELIGCRSVTPNEGGALAVLVSHLSGLGFATQRLMFCDTDTPDVENLFASVGTGTPHLVFAGHTDVVPPGDEGAWHRPPFAGEIADGKIYGRGAVDMKGGIACFVAAVGEHVNKHGIPKGTISFLITGDEEGPSINGTDKLLKWAADQGNKFDACIVGEPTNPDTIGDAIKIGRRGSLSGEIIVDGVQGHSAYPHLADNPLRGLADLLDPLQSRPFDAGTEQFQATNLEVTSIDVGNPAVNVIPAEARARFNIRFNDLWDEERLKGEIIRRLDEGAALARARTGKDRPVQYRVEWIGRVSPVFLTRDNNLIAILSAAVEAVTGKMPELSTGGGTSDARFIKDYCPVVEFGLVGKTMHQIDEHTEIADLKKLTDIYRDFLQRYFAKG